MTWREDFFTVLVRTRPILANKLLLLLLLQREVRVTETVMVIVISFQGNIKAKDEKLHFLMI